MELEEFHYALLNSRAVLQIFYVARCQRAIGLSDPRNYFQARENSLCNSQLMFPTVAYSSRTRLESRLQERSHEKMQLMLRQNGACASGAAKIVKLRFQTASRRALLRPARTSNGEESCNANFWL
jgi:hypothetical protein